VNYFDKKILKSDFAEHIIDALYNVPKKAIPDIITDAAGYKSVLGRTIERPLRTWYGVHVYQSDILINGNRIWSSDLGMSPKGKNIMTVDKDRFNTGDFCLVAFNIFYYKTIKELTNYKEKVEIIHNKRVNNGYSFNTDGKLVIYHEFGHVFDYRNNDLSDKQEWKDIRRKWHYEMKLDILKSESEAFAEGFADYFGNNGDKLPKYVKEYFSKLEV
jgi:hypothetical protein